ncbi:MAG: hypothetical protein AAGF84_12910 [Planctomycetota bacterium]
MNDRAGAILAGWAMLLGVLVTLVGCAASDHARPESPDRMPSDFAMVLTISNADPQAERHLRPAQYVLEPDGTLRAAIGPGTHAELLPPITARLGPAEMHAVWRDTAPLLPPAPDSDTQSLALQASVTADRRTDRGYLDAARANLLLERLASLRGDGRRLNPGP